MRRRRADAHYAQELRHRCRAGFPPRGAASRADLSGTRRGRDVTQNGRQYLINFADKSARAPVIWPSAAAAAWSIRYDPNGEVRKARPRSRGTRLSAVSRRARQENFRERIERGVEAVARAPENAGQREPPESRGQKG